MAATKLIVNRTRGEGICVGTLANRPLSRMRGLIGRRGLAAGEGLLLMPAPAIHTAFMRFPIDALFLDRHLRVLDVAERLRPWRFASARKARAVLELSAGECARRGVQVGDTLELCENTANSASLLAAAVLKEDAVGSDITPANPWPDDGLGRLRPLGVLVVSSDRHFRTAISMLLARRNCSVTTTANAARVAELIARDNVDVVVVDHSSSSAAETATTVRGLARPVGVVAVAGEARAGIEDPPILVKWGPFEELFAAIEDAAEQHGRLGDAGVRG